MRLVGKVGDTTGCLWFLSSLGWDSGHGPSLQVYEPWVGAPHLLTESGRGLLDLPWAFPRRRRS
jgi:hypothetical protein